MQVVKMRFCSPQVSRVWKPTMFQAVPATSSMRSCTTAYGCCPVRGSISPTGFIGPKASVSSPRSAITSMGRQPSKYFGSSKACGVSFWPAFTSATKR